jgi:hypothetical protein
MLNLSPEVWTFVAAELVLVLARSRDLTVLIKSKAQRTRLEQQDVNRGLLRGLFLEALLFVPASSLLLLLLSPVVLPVTMSSSTPSTTAAYALVGIASYGFPFAAIKRAITRIAANTLREFVTLVPADLRQGGHTLSREGDT